MAANDQKTEQIIKKKKLQKIGVFTSGGDAPGMNAAIRAVTRAALANKLKVVGIRRGYQGMIEGDFINLKSSEDGTQRRIQDC
jgi:6-phosphofructokinase 1